ncbi:MAG: hypothetical protein J4F97_07120 [Pseudomonadales bacterium]|nr:hypothetical protein [Pseudomonadales bacterium]
MVRPNSGALVSEAQGLVLAGLDDQHSEIVHESLLECRALALHGQGYVTVQESLDFGEKWGEIDVVAIHRRWSGGSRCSGSARAPATCTPRKSTFQGTLPPKFSMLLAGTVPHVNDEIRDMHPLSVVADQPPRGPGPERPWRTWGESPPASTAESAPQSSRA